MALEEAGVKLIAQGADAFGADLKSATKAVDGFGKEADKAATLVQDAAGRWRTSTGRFASDAEKAAAGVETVAPAAKKAGDAAEQAGRDAEKGGHGFDAFGEIVTGALRKVGEIAVDALAEASKATVAFLKDSVSLAGDFDAGMREFQAVAGQDVDTQGLDQFRDLFLQLGKELPVSTSAVQQAASEMVKGGIDPAIVAAGGLRQNIQFAAAAMEGDLVGAAEISSKILGGWADASATAQQKADFLTHSTDLLTKAANASSVDVHELSLGIFNAQGIAKTAGIGFDDLTTTLAELAPRFASSSEAGNSLKNMIARLQPQTKTAAGYMLDLGLITEEGGNKFYDAEGKFVGFQKTSELLKDALSGLTEQQRTLYLQQIFGNDAMGSAAALADLGASGYQRMADSLDKANGVTENAALKQAGFNTSLENAKGSVEAFQITAGSLLLPVLSDLLDHVIAPGINTLTDMTDALSGNDEAFNRLSPTIQGIVSVIDIVVADVQEIIGAFDEAGAMSSEFGESIGLLASDLGLPGELIQDIVFGVQDLVGWFGKARNASADLGGVINDLSGIWQRYWGVVEDVMGGYQAIAQAVLPIVKNLWSAHGTEITGFLKSTYDSVIEIVNLALDLYDAIVPPALHAIADFFEAHGSQIEKILTGAGQAIGAIVTGTMETIKGIFKLALDLIHGDWDAAWKDLLGIGKAQGDAIGGVVTGILNMIAGLFDTTLDDILQTWEDNWNMAVEIVSEIDWAQVGENAVNGILQGLRDNWDHLMGWVADKAGDLVDAALDAIGAHSPATKFIPVGTFAVQGIMAGFAEAWPALTSQIGSLSSDLIDQMSSIGDDIQDVIADSFGVTASIDRQMAKNLEKIGKMGSEFDQQVTAQSLETEQRFAETFADPKVGAQYYKMMSDAIFETADLRQKIADAESQEEKDRLNQQLILISRAQDAERDRFFAQNPLDAQGPLRDIADQIADLVRSSGVGILDNPLMALLDGLAERLRNASHRAKGGPVEAGMPYWVGEHGKELFWPSMNGMVSPAASSAQMAARGPVYNGQVGNTYNTTMPIYTNNSPAAMQQSWAIMQASMP